MTIDNYPLTKIYICVVFQKCRLHLAKILFFVLLFYFNLSADHSEYVDYRLKILRKLKIIVRSKKRKIQIL